MFDTLDMGAVWFGDAAPTWFPAHLEFFGVRVLQAFNNWFYVTSLFPSELVVIFNFLIKT